MEKSFLSQKITLTNSLTVKLISIACLVGALMLPSQMIQSLIKEREARKAEVLNELSAKWGNAQTIAGPILSIPYQSGGNQINYLHILPEELTITGELTPEIRYRGIFEAVLYGADVQIQGKFRLPDVYESTLAAEDLRWSDAILSVGISDVRGIKEKIQVTLDNTTVPLNAGKLPLTQLPSGVKAKVVLSEFRQAIAVTLRLKLNGNGVLNVIPVGSATTATLTSSWNSPSFNGALLPVERTVSNKGFTATWNVLEVNREYPQFWVDQEYNLNNSALGVNLLIPVDIYQKSMRAAKYAFIFVILTFAAFFFAEILHNYRIHPIQYLLIGFAVMVFYTLLLSISEHLRFWLAYLIASTGVTLLITGYAQAILDRRSFTFSVFGLLSGLYGYLYVLLQMEDYSLLSGSIGFFLLLSIIMFATRKVNWYAITFGRPQPMEEPEPFDAIDFRPTQTAELEAAAHLPPRAEQTVRS